MPRFFNTSGPNRPDRHYTLPMMARLPEVRELIDQEQYFVVHASRQVGKTTALPALAQELTAEGSHVAVLLSMEQGAPFPKDPGAAERAILEAWRDRLRARLPPDLQPPPWPDAAPGNRIGSALRAWAEAAPRPLVVFLDEVDALQDEALISVLRQLRGGYPDRPGTCSARCRRMISGSRSTSGWSEWILREGWRWRTRSIGSWLPGGAGGSTVLRS